MFSQRDGLVQHVLELGEDAGDLPDDHGEGGGAPVSPDGDVCPVTEQQVGTVAVLVEGSDMEGGVAELVLVVDVGPGVQQHLDTLVRPRALHYGRVQGRPLVQVLAVGVTSCNKSLSVLTDFSSCCLAVVEEELHSLG